MTVVVYPAIVTPEGEGLLGRFVDFPDVVFSGGAASDLVRAARETLAAQLQRLEQVTK